MGMLGSSIERRRLFVVGTAALIAACGGKILAESGDAGPPIGAPSAQGATAPASTTTIPREAGPDVVESEKPQLPPSAQLVDLGNHRTGETISFTVPPGTLGFQIVIQGDEAAFETVRVDKLESSSGDVVFLDGKPRGTDVPTAEGQGWASAAVPQADVYRKSPVEPGLWKAKIFSDTSSTKMLRVHLALQHTSDGFFHGGELDLHVYVPIGLFLSQPGPRHEVTIAGAPTDPAILARIDAFYELLHSLVGIGRGRVAFHGIPEHFNEIPFDTDELFEAFRETRVTVDQQALHVVFTNDLAGALGVAPAVPGNAMETGTSLSAIAVAQFEESSPELDAFTMLHEMGHFVGLSHTSEFSFPGEDGGLYDPLPDTPTCDGGVTEDNIFSCPDFSNIMFPTGEQETGLLSLAQVRVMRGSPVYRAKASGPVVAPPRLPLSMLPALKNLPQHLKRCRLITRRK